MDVREPMATLDTIERVAESNQKIHESYHIPPSSLGTECDRALWLNFRWVKGERKTARMLRLLDRGAREEKEIVKHLKTIGIEIENTGGKQLKVKASPWVVGRPDGIIRKGLVESPNNPHIAEFKTSNEKAFKDLQKKGVQLAKPEHYVQMQVYMYALNIPRAFYWCVCKNNDEVYTERIKLDEEFALEQIRRGDELAVEPNLPGRISNDPEHFKCRFCRWHDFCYDIKPVEVQHNCRTCEACEIRADGSVYCRTVHKKLTKAVEKAGCEFWDLHFDLKQSCTS